MKLDTVIRFKNSYKSITKNDKLAKHETNDCFVRAVMHAFDISYDEAHAFVTKQFGRQPGEGTCNPHIVLRRMAINSMVLFDKYQLQYLGKNPLDAYSYYDPEILFNESYPVYRTNENGEEVISYAGYTVGKFIQQHQTGTYIIIVAGHALTVKDGVLIDNPEYNDRLLKHQLRDQRRCKYIFQVKKAEKKLPQRLYNQKTVLIFNY